MNRGSTMSDKTISTLRTTISRRSTLKGLAAAAGLIAAPGFVRYTQAQSAAPIKIGFQAHRTGIGAAYGRWYEKHDQCRGQADQRGRRHQWPAGRDHCRG